MCGRREIHRGLRWGDLKGRDFLEYVGANWRIILKCILQKQCGGCVDWINLAEDSDICERVISLRVSYNAENMLTSVCFPRETLLQGISSAFITRVIVCSGPH